jgi:hypothetical protein
VISTKYLRTIGRIENDEVPRRAQTTKEGYDPRGLEGIG